jgi:cytochrome c556
MISKPSLGIVATISTLILSAVSFTAAAQAPGGGGPSPAERAIEYRQALYTVLANKWGPIGQMLAGRMPFNGPDAAKRATQAAQIAAMLPDAFPDISKNGDTKAKPEIWANRAEFDKLVTDLGDHTAALAAVLAKDATASDAFKSAATAVANDCKTCHDKFRAK